MAISSVHPARPLEPVAPPAGRTGPAPSGGIASTGSNPPSKIASEFPASSVNTAQPLAKGAEIRGERHSGPERTSKEEPGRNEASTSQAERQAGLTGEELKELSRLKARDREVRTHEQAHQAAGGQYAGAASYTYQKGPDGSQYAVGGKVPIDVSPVEGDPQATIEKMRTVQAAAMAPAQPSSQDRAVAAQAMQLMLQAQTELTMERQAEQSREPDAGFWKGNSISASHTYREVAGIVDGNSSSSSFQAYA